jgi:Lrp/AsnC family transcriptional regulator for asnA, asnC and gidA
MIDQTDIKIINSLLTNSRQSTKALAEPLNISNVATQSRIDKLENSGIIKGYTATIDYKLLGYNTIAYVGIFLEKARHYPKVKEKLSAVSEITEAYFTTGNYSIFTKIYAKDNFHLMDILSEKVQVIDGIARTETFICLEEGVKKEMMVAEEL